MKRYLCWSGGKDSSASIGLCYEYGIPLDGIVMSEVMFDHKRGISGENPEHIKWVYEEAIPIIENKLHYKVIVLKDKSDYMQEFYHKNAKSKKPERVGKYSGFFIGGMCAGNDRLKMRPMRNFFKQVGECEQIVGIAYDEPKRLARLTDNKRSILAEKKVVEADTHDICKYYGLYSPTYRNKNRGGCWFCPNQSIFEFACLQRQHPELWQELEIMAQCENLCFPNFKYGKSFKEVANEVFMINNQISMFD